MLPELLPLVQVVFLAPSREILADFELDPKDGKVEHEEERDLSVV